MTPTWLTVLLAVIAALGTGTGTHLVRGMVERRTQEAQVDQITAAAHKQIYASYGDLLGELRHDLELSREDARSARSEAREANLRAVSAEARATAAEARAAVAETQLTEMRKIVETHFGTANAEQVLGGLGRPITAMA